MQKNKLKTLILTSEQAADRKQSRVKVSEDLIPESSEGSGNSQVGSLVEIILFIFPGRSWEDHYPYTEVEIK